MGDVIDLPNKDSGHGTQPPHGSSLCGANKKQGPGTCTKTKGWGTDHVGYGRCKLHGGNTESGKKAAAEEAAATAVTIMGEEMDVEPHEALLACVRIARGEVAYCSIEILKLEKATEPTMFGEVLNVWITTRQKALDRLAKYSKMAIDAGVAERQVQLAERYGEMIASLIGGILGDLKLTKAQKDAAREIVPRRLQALEAGTG